MGILCVCMCDRFNNKYVLRKQSVLLLLGRKRFYPKQKMAKKTGNTIKSANISIDYNDSLYDNEYYIIKNY